MSVVIISAVLMTLVFTLSIASFFNRFDVLDAENKRISLGLAEACVNSVMLKIAQNSAYTPAPSRDCVSVGGTCGGSDPQKVCKICSVTTSGNFATTTVRAMYNGTYTNLTIGMNSTPGSFSVLNWSETNTGAGTCTVP